MDELKELEGLEDLKADDVVDGMTVEIDEEIKRIPMVSKTGKAYNKYLVAVSLDVNGTERRNLWMFAQEARKIIKECGTAMKNYLGAVLTLGVEEATLKDGRTYKEIVIKEVKKRS